ncbi:MAG: hypothetical protein HFJ00_13975 [Lachnospiraceae bacterium]|nr:hypothetical protein [Lachnospiraceae bacterium]
MAIVQEAFDIPADIMTKLLTGEYRRIGGVIRYAIGPKKGQIVKHLDPVDLEAAEQAQSFGVKALQFAKNNKKGIIIGAAITGAVTAGGYIYYKLKTREPAVVAEFRSKLRIYIEEIRNGNLELDTINGLMAALDALKQHKDYEKYSIALSTDDLDVLVNRIYDYTIKLAENNDIELTEKERTQTDNSIINLQNYLKVQRRIFEYAA